MGTVMMTGQGKNDPIYVTKSFLPPKNEYDKITSRIWEGGQLTNNGPLLKEFEKKVAKYLGVEYFQFVTNGTLALQLAIDGLGITDGEIITTPFSYVATTSAILWQRCTPIFVDIDEETLNIDPAKIEAAITPSTKAILAVHVFGNACDVDAIQRIADKHDLKVIYDGAHAFGASYEGRSLLKNGDVSIASFHATKLFHTIEGGGVISRTKDIHDSIDLKKRFGHNGDTHYVLGINAKANEFQAAMGLANLPYLDGIIASREQIWYRYQELFEDLTVRGQMIRQPMDGYNFAYAPAVFASESDMIKVKEALERNNIFPRRYFFPSLNTLPYIKSSNINLELSESVASRVLCLPLYDDLSDEDVDRIKYIIRSTLSATQSEI